MSIKLYKGLNFGQNLGPIQKTPDSGKIIWVESSPLDPGHWGIEIGTGEPHGFIRDDDPGGPNQGKDHWAGGINDSGRRRSPTGILLPSGEPKWGRVITGDGPTGRTSEESCSPEAKAKILAAYKKLMEDKKWDQNLSQFFNLKQCMIDHWVSGELTIMCGEVKAHKNFPSILGFSEDNYHQAGIINITPLALGDPNFLLRALVANLVFACGGTYLDAYVIASLPDSSYLGGEWFTELGKNDSLEFETKWGSDKEGEYQTGTYIKWYPKTGKLVNKENGKRLFTSRFDKNWRHI